jgi:hypothetical protein
MEKEKRILDFLMVHKKPFSVDTFRDLFDRFDKGEISMSKAVEELNIAAFNWRESLTEQNGNFKKFTTYSEERSVASYNSNATLTEQKPPVEQGEHQELIERCWFYFKGNDKKKTISKEAFLHEVGAILQQVNPEQKVLEALTGEQERKEESYGQKLISAIQKLDDLGLWGNYKRENPEIIAQLKKLVYGS